MRQETAAGRLPAAPVMDGIIILIAGALLITPGILTDAFGFFCLIPPCRELLKRHLKAWLEPGNPPGHRDGLRRFGERIVGRLSSHSP